MDRHDQRKHNPRRIDNLSRFNTTDHRVAHDTWIGDQRRAADSRPPWDGQWPAADRRGPPQLDYIPHQQRWTSHGHGQAGNLPRHIGPNSDRRSRVRPRKDADADLSSPAPDADNDRYHSAFHDIAGQLRAVSTESTVFSEGIQNDGRLGLDLAEEIRRVAAQQYTHYASNQKVQITENLLNQIVTCQGECQGLLMGYVIVCGRVFIDEFMQAATKKSTSTGKRRKVSDNDNRPQIVKEMMQRAIDYAASDVGGRRDPPKDTYFMVFISDHNIWNIPDQRDMDLVLSLPIACFAKPKNEHNPLFPETTFGQFSFEEKYKDSGSVSWSESMRRMEKEVTRQQNDGTVRKAAAFFKGAMTGQFLYNIRSQLFAAHDRIQSPFMCLESSEKGNYTPPYNWYAYKYFLNLPGHYPWSNRLKYLLLLDGIIFHVNVSSTNYEDEDTNKIRYCDQSYITFLELFIDEDHYCTRVYSFESVKEKKKDSRAKEKIDELYHFIVETVKRCETDSAFYDECKKKCESAKEKLLKLNDNAISEYIYTCMCENAKIVEIGDRMSILSNAASSSSADGAVAVPLDPPSSLFLKEDPVSTCNVPADGSGGDIVGDPAGTGGTDAVAK